MRVIVISDIHLGTGVSRLKALMDTLSNEEFDILVINGDLVQDDNWNRLKKEAWKFLGKCRGWTAAKKRKKIVWCEGNHDKDAFYTLGHIVGFHLVGEKRHYKLEIGGKTYLFMHGHRLDKWMPKNKFWCDFWGSFYDRIQLALGEEKRHLARQIKLRSKKVLGVCDSIRERASRYGKHHGANVVCCGHVHHAEDTKCKNGVVYVNTGSITERPSYYLVIDENGHQLFEF
jgi:predicted phosphodiesterase